MLGRKASSYALPKGCQVEGCVFYLRVVGEEGWVVVKGVQVGVPVLKHCIRNSYSYSYNYKHE